MKLFHFYRAEDQSGVSGTGPVVEGVEFTNGWCALRWLSSKSSICFYQSLNEVKAIHGHGGKTEIVVHDFAPSRKKEPVGATKRFEILLQIIEEASHINVLAEDPTISREVLRESVQELQKLVRALEISLELDLPRSA